MKNDHVHWIDFGKSLAIFLVVLFHTHCNQFIDTIITAFTIPAFLFMSGYVFSYERNPNFGPFIYKRFRQLIIPYLWINLIAYLLWLTVLRHYGADADSNLSWTTPFLGIITGVPPLLSHDIPLWSLLCFFVVEIIFYPICKYWGSDWVIAIIFTIISFILTLNIDASRLPIAFGPAVTGIIFYSLGHFYRRVENQKWLSKYILMIPAVVCFCLGIHYNSEVEFFICNFGNYWLFLLSSVSGTAILVFSMKIVAQYINEYHFIKFIARSTLLICGFHLLAFAAIKGLFFFGFGISPDILTNGIINGMLFAMTAFILTLPVAYIVFQYFPALIDK